MCPNPTCMNHRAMVFGTKVSCPVCGAPRPESSFGAADSVWPEANQAWTNPVRNPSGKLSTNARAGSISYGNTDNLSKLIRDCGPMPYFVPTPDPVFDDRKRFAERPEDVAAAMSWENLCKAYRRGKKSRSRSRSRSKRKKKKRRRKSSSSSSSSTSSSRSGGAKGRRGSDKQASSTAVEVEEVEDTNATTAEKNPAVEKAKNEALQKVIRLKESDIAVDEKRRQWRALLREWHPDKHADNVEVATAVFQFLQKAKSILNLDG